MFFSDNASLCNLHKDEAASNAGTAGKPRDEVVSTATKYEGEDKEPESDDPKRLDQIARLKVFLAHPIVAAVLAALGSVVTGCTVSGADDTAIPSEA